MNTLVVFPHLGLYRYCETVLQSLGHRGHDLCIVAPHPDTVNVAKLDEETRRRIHEQWHVEVMPDGAADLSWATRTSRQLLDYRQYLIGRHPSSGLASLWRSYLPWTIRGFLRTRPFQRLLTTPHAAIALRAAEERVGPNRRILDWLKEKRPDVVITWTNLPTSGPEVEYLKAAARLGIPIVMGVCSWDNLTTKGTVHVMPDLIIVWNQALATEATELHGVPPDRIVTVGAPPFDYLFQQDPDPDRASFCRRAGLDPDRQYLLYLCSSRSIAGDEHMLVDSLVQTLRSCEQTRHLGILVRPHPLNTAIWSDYANDEAVVWPRHGSMPATREARQDYIDSMYHSLATIGVNTSAMIEAAALDRPGIVVLTERYRRKQSDIGHFQHLLRGDFLEVAHGFSECPDVVTRLLQGCDGKSIARRRFVSEFIRPAGMHRTAGEVAATAIEAVASKQPRVANPLHAIA